LFKSTVMDNAENQKADESLRGEGLLDGRGVALRRSRGAVKGNGLANAGTW
jgi:hypothetical protein